MSKSSGMDFTACLGSGSQACDVFAGGDEGDDEGDDSSCLFLEQKFVYGSRPLTSKDLEVFIK